MIDAKRQQDEVTDKVKRHNDEFHRSADGAKRLVEEVNATSQTIRCSQD